MTILPAGSPPAGGEPGEFVRRPEDPEDAALLFDLFRDANGDPFAGIDPALAGTLLRQQFAGQRMSYRAAFPQARFDVVEVDGKPVGRIVVAYREDGVRLVDVALLRTARGRGLGTALVRALQAEARAARLPLRLSVALSNAAARRLYARLGFALAGGTETHLHMQWTP